MRILILEDDPNRHVRFRRNLIGAEITIVDQAQDAIELLKTKEWDLLCLDHDLGGKIHVDSSEPNTGYAVAKWLEENPKFQPKEIILHSLNPVGRENMKKCLPNAKEIPCAWDLIRIKSST